MCGIISAMLTNFIKRFAENTRSISLKAVLLVIVVVEKMEVVLPLLSMTVWATAKPRTVKRLVRSLRKAV